MPLSPSLYPCTFPSAGKEVVTHLRVNMGPDGGIARLQV
ncbi:allantoicase, partial [archaeon]